MKAIKISGVILLLFSFSMQVKAYRPAKKDKELINKVANWQMTHLTDTFPDNHWTRAALYRGLAEWAECSQSEAIYDFLHRMGKRCQWNMLPRVYDADDLCIGQTYIKLYERYKNPEMIGKVLDRVHSVISKPKTMDLNVAAPGKYNRERWGWCDALFMAPPVYARLAGITGETALLDYSFAEFRVTTDSLYDRTEKLFYRDLRWIRVKEPDGSKLFWGRGNGWVYAGLALMLASTPRSHPSYLYYQDLYLQMSESILAYQDKNGSWHTSLLDAALYPEPENSASGFFVYGLAWGVNNGILKKKTHRIAARKGWEALKSYVNPEGRLGYIQPVGHAPYKNLTAEMTSTYGVGAFLLAGSEICRMKKQGSDK
jgi:rhamnogalacturonyl hydrolase YesR